MESSFRSRVERFKDVASLKTFGQISNMEPNKMEIHTYRFLDSLYLKWESAQGITGEYRENLDAIERDPYKLSGAWVFRKTRVPVSALFENLRDGATVEDFLEWFPPIERSQVEAVLNYELDMLAVVA